MMKSKGPLGWGTLFGKSARRKRNRRSDSRLRRGKLLEMLEHRRVLAGADINFMQDENTVDITTFFSDDDSTFEVSGGVDQAQLEITPDNMLRFIAPPNFENPEDVGGDNAYDIEVTQTRPDNSTSSFTVCVTVEDVDELPQTEVTLVGGVLTITDSNGGDSNDDFTIGFDGNDYTITDNAGEVFQTVIAGSTGNGTDALTIPATGITSIEVNSLGGDDQLTVDFGAGNLPVPLSFDGGDQDDTLAIDGGNFTTITSSHTSASAGQIDLDGSLVAYTGLEPVLLNVGSAADIIFNLPAGPNPDVVIGDDGFGDDPNGNTSNVSAIDGSTFEYTEFTNPSNSLTVNLGTASNTTTLRAMDPLFAPAGGGAAFVINGDSAIDVTNVQATTAGIVTRINSGNSSDIVNVSSNAPLNTGTLDEINGRLQVNGGLTIADELNISSSGSTVADVVTVDATLFTGTAAGGWEVQLVTFGQTGGVNLSLGSAADTIEVNSFLQGQPVTVNANGGDDTFNVNGTLGANQSVNLNGGSPTVPASPGDTLNLPPNSAVLSNNDGSGSAPGLVTSFSGIETIVGSLTGDIVIDGTGDDDTLIVTASSNDDGTYQLVTDGVAGPVVNFFDAASITFNGLAGDDILRSQ